eukprot:TRINITY_DN499_c0_g1_i3.p1 TRINITY_DN499_c0_g1~~TRINITY_DN499_c0_g1_i3.p1  ORF type:complete len:166 (+),score=31.78 TRINITY_DN499_c0_g1_i3:41-538(+)
MDVEKTTEDNMNRPLDDIIKENALARRKNRPDVKRGTIRRGTTTSRGRANIRRTNSRIANVQTRRGIQNNNQFQQPQQMKNVQVRVGASAGLRRLPIISRGSTRGVGRTRGTRGRPVGTVARTGSVFRFTNPNQANRGLGYTNRRGIQRQTVKQAQRFVTAKPKV